ncbi:MAG: hypothetical protein JWM53_2426, partial [bacterium]|nr:hypothetical protein [bacterium]
GIASAVQGSTGSTGGGLLPLGALMPADTPEDVFVTALSGGNLLGMARIRDVVIKGGKKASYEAPLRKPLVFVGSSLPPETASGNATRGVQILDPVASIDLTKSAMSPPSVAGGMTAGATTWDGRFLVVAQGGTLTAFDSGSGKNVPGGLTLAFQPSRLVVAPRDLAIVALDPGTGSDGSLVIISDVAGFAAAPASAAPKTVRMPGAIARTATFSPDGSKLYVLTGGPTTDPCAPGATLAANVVQVYGLDGSMITMFTLPGFAADLAVDPQTGMLVVADVAGKQIATLDPSSGATTKVLGNLTCPSAVRVVNGTAFVVTSDHDTTQPDRFVLQRVPIKGGAATATPFAGPNYNIPIDSTPSSNGDIGMALLPVRPVSIEAYELAITPDGSRAEFATRAVYNEAGTQFMFSGENCTANFNIVEYGLFAVDVRTGNAAYEQHAQLVVKGATSCVVCKLPSPFPDQQVGCASQAGDRPSGLAASFGQ